MSLLSDGVKIQTTVCYQKQKLYIEDLEIKESFKVFEKDLTTFLSKYGKVLDIKILKNRKLNRTTETLCFRNL